MQIRRKFKKGVNLNWDSQFLQAKYVFFKSVFFSLVLDECKTYGDLTCKFPFKFQNQTHYDCIGISQQVSKQNIMALR